MRRCDYGFPAVGKKNYESAADVYRADSTADQSRASAKDHCGTRTVDVSA